MSVSTRSISARHPCNILLIQLGDIGDVVLTTPTIRAIKKAYPDARVSILIFKPYGSLLAADPNVYEVVETARIRSSLRHRLWEAVVFTRRLRQKQYDLVIDLRTGDRGAILSFITGAQERVGQHVDKPFWHDFLFTKIIHNLQVAPPPAHPGADQSLRIVRELGIDTSDSIPKLYITPDDQLRANALLAEFGLTSATQIVTANPFSRWKYKEWNNAKWGEIIDVVWEAYHIPVLLIGSLEEAAACQKIVAGRKGRVINLAGRTTLGELTALLSMSSLHLGVDSAAPHIAAAVGTPTVTIHGPSDWRAWRIIDDLHKIVIPTMECVPCNQRGCDNTEMSQCLENLEAGAVIDVIGQVLRKTNMRSS